MKKLIIFCAFILFFLNLKAQIANSIKGRVIDTSSTAILSNASISVLNKKDSTLVKFTFAQENGTFELNKLNKGKFILLISYPRYADYIEEFTLDSNRSLIDFGKINMQAKARLLADVIIKAKRAALRINGDTTEFDPRAFNIEPNSKVEDLIKQFPGIEVDKDGKITAQGQTVTKVLVDGEEFFGDDPTLVTKNLRADMVDKVQLYDKKSDQATFTGIDDGIKTKTLNIKLKEDKKNGYFGKAHGGYGTEDFYHAELMYNKFWGKKKFSVYGVTANTGKVGLSWADQEKYGNRSNMTISDDGDIEITSGGEFETFSGQYFGSGIPLARTGGIHLDNKWNKDKEMLNTNYKIGSFEVGGNRNSLNFRNLSNGVINSSSSQDFRNDLFSQKLDFMYEIKLDTTSTIKFSVDGNLKKGNNHSASTAESTRGDNSLLNNSVSESNNHAENQEFNFASLFTKKFAKKRRTLSLTINQSVKTDHSNGYQNSVNNYYNTQSAIDSTQVVNQYKVNLSKNNAFRSNLVFTEPLSNVLTLAINYGFNILNSKSDVKSFDKGGNGEYNIIDEKFSTDYDLDQIHHQAGAVFNYNKGKNVVNIGSKFTKVNYEQYDVLRDKMYKRNFINYSPQASYQFKFTQQKSFRISYNGSTRQPSLNQIQPLRDNSNQLYQTIGNPDLKPSYSSSFNANYSFNKVISQENFYIYGNYNFTVRPIINKVDISSGGQSISQFINLKDKASSYYNLSANYNRKINFFNLNTGIYAYTSGGVSYNYLNGALNQTNNNVYGVSLSLSKYTSSYYSFRINGGPSYNQVETTVGTDANSNGWRWKSSAYFSLKKLPGKMELSTDLNYDYQGKTQKFNDDFQKTIWNASLIKKFFKTENFKISITANDILNQNIGFNRSDYNGNISQNSYTTIKRYFIVAALWDFSQMGNIQKK